MLINGKSTLFKGVDRHDNSPLNGRTVSKEEMEKDIKLMKSLNINAVLPRIIPTILTSTIYATDMVSM